MNYEEKIRLAKEALNSGSYDKETIEYIFPELEENEDERIRKDLISFLDDILYYGKNANFDKWGKSDCSNWIAWLEKQGESVEINPTEFDTRLQGTYQTPDEIIEECHQDNADRIIDIVTEHGNPSEWNEEDENEYNHILKILNLVAEEQETKGYNNLISSVNWFKSLKDRIQPKQNNNPQGKTALEAIKEEKVDNSNKVEPKFKVGDWVVRKDGGVFDTETKFAQITEIDGEKHWFDTGLICLKAEDMRLWTLEDAKDGDILYSEKHNLLWRYKNTKECYYCINLNYNNNNISIGNEIVIPNDVRPASKELRDWQFDKMLQHTFRKINGKKELKFHEGDWVIGVATEFKPRQIVEVLTSGYKTSNGGWIGLSFECGMHLWTIADAKDGDVLVASDGSIFIFAGVVDYTCKYYAALTLYNGLSINKEVELGSWELANHVHPATKEQCDLLFAKMREKGYEWDDEKKLLKN